MSEPQSRRIREPDGSAYHVEETPAEQRMRDERHAGRVNTPTRAILAAGFVLLVLSVLWLGSHRYTFLASERFVYRCDRWTGNVDRALVGGEWQRVPQP